MSSVNDWVRKVHHLAVEAGWWLDHEIDRDLKPDARAAKHMLVVTEIAEATEAVREQRPPIYQMMGEHVVDDHFLISVKPEGECIELADAVIRIMDYFGFMGWDLEKAIAMKHEYNKSRAFRHGGKAL